MQGMGFGGGYDPSVPEKVDARLRLEGLILGGLLMLCFVLPWMSMSFRSRSETVFAWDLMGKKGSLTFLVLWFLIAGGASLALGALQLPRRVKGLGFLALGSLTVLLFVTVLMDGMAMQREAQVSGTLLLMMLLGLLALAFGTTHWASRPEVPIAKIATGVGLVLLLLAHLVPLQSFGGERKMLFSLMLETFKSRDPIGKVMGLYMFMPLVAMALASVVMLPPAPGGHGSRPAVARIAGMLSMLYLPGLFLIVWFVSMKQTDYTVKPHMIAYLGLLLRGAFSWTVHGLDAAMLGDAPGGVPAMPYGQPGYAGAPAAVPMSPACPRCTSPATWVAQYGRWFCQRCQQYL